MSRYSPNLAAASRENTYYALTMFPYPSGIGLHCGHASTFTITDVLARYQRMLGKTVFMPFGFDAFGLPTENYAMKLGKPAREVTDTNKKSFIKQVEALNISFDYERVLDTSTPEYYKWTQRLFARLYKAGLAYRDTLWVNRCPNCQTVLANDQVVDGKCERCKSEIQQKQMPQWFIKVTAYADRLIEDLDTIDRPEETKIAQKNRIGRSEGAEVDFSIALPTSKHQQETVAYYQNYGQQYIQKNHGDIVTGLKGTYAKVLANKSHDIRIREIGSGSGRDADYIESQGFTVKRSDIAQPFIEYNQENNKEIDSIDILTDTLDEKNDVIIATAVLVHFTKEEVQKAIQTISQGLKEGGEFMFSYRDPKAHKREEDTRHFNTLSIQDYTDILKEAGLTITYSQQQEEDYKGKKAIWTYAIAQKKREQNNTSPITTSITCFTTRPDTLMGVTGIVLAPESTIIDQYMDEHHQQQVQEYRNIALAKTAVQRQKDSKEKTGVFSGVYALHPLSRKKIPVRLADYVLPDYGTGAVMIVPAHDQRDREFADKFGIPKITVIQALEQQEKEEEVYTGPGILINSGTFNGMDNTQAQKEITQHLEQTKQGRTKISYRLRDWSVSRQRYWGSPIPVYYDIPKTTVPLYEYKDEVRQHKEGEETVVRNVIQLIVKDKESDRYCFLQQKGFNDINTFFGGLEGEESHEEACHREAYEEAGLTDLIVKEDLGEYHCKFYHPTKHRNQYSICKCFYAEASKSQQIQISKEEAAKHDVIWLTADEFLAQSNNTTSKYYLNKHLGRKQEEWPTTTQYNEFNPLPEDKKVPHLIPDEELPVILPLDIANYKPKGKSPLEDHPTFPYYEKEEKTYLRECDTLDTFMCSSFYFLRFPDTHNQEEFLPEKLAEKLFPIPLYTGGKEHTVGHLLYARFIHKFLYDEGIVPSPEPFSKLVHQGMVLGSDGRKMGKRYNNGVDPLVVIDKYGTDAVRVYMMFMGPVEQDKARNDGALQGVKKFLDRIERIKDKERFGTENTTVDSVLHQTIKGLTHDMEQMKLNTGVSKLMILINTIYEHKACTREQLKTTTLLLAPYATQLADTLWAALGGTDDVHFHPWPTADESKIQGGELTIPVQINGKVRGKIHTLSGLSEEEIMKEALQQENVAKYTDGQTIKKVIRIQDKILNIIV